MLINSTTVSKDGRGEAPLQDHLPGKMRTHVTNTNAITVAGLLQTISFSFKSSSGITG